MPHYRIRVEGKVQGVFFRANTQRQATELGILGWVKNEVDGSVTISAQGKQEGLNQLIDWCRRGPDYARVTKVEFKALATEDFNSFRIVR